MLALVCVKCVFPLAVRDPFFVGMVLLWAKEEKGLDGSSLMPFFEPFGMKETELCLKMKRFRFIG